MQFQPKNIEQINQEAEERKKASVWPAGIYSFEIIPHFAFGDTVVATTDCVSKKGNEMIKLVLKIYNDRAEERVIIDHLMPQIEAKLWAAAHTCNLMELYNMGQLHAFDFLGKRGELQLGIVSKGEYAGRNEVVNYIASDTVSADLHPYHPDAPF